MARSLPATIARLPKGVRERVGLLASRVDQRHVDVAISVMGLLYLAAAIDGWRSAGRGRLFHDVQLVFGLHGFGHVASAIATRGYTTGVATSPTVVLPQWWWARSRLARAGVPDASRLGRALAIVGAWLAVSHAIGALASRRARPRARSAAEPGEAGA